MHSRNSVYRIKLNHDTFVLINVMLTILLIVIIIVACVLSRWVLDMSWGIDLVVVYMGPIAPGALLEGRGSARVGKPLQLMYIKH